MINYIKDQYGENSVTQIITFGKMKAKQVVRDVGRVMGYSFSDVDKIAKAIPNELNITLERKINMLDDVEIIEEKSEKIITDVLSINVIGSKEFQEESNSDLSDIVQRFSGITLTDNQISIRGGSGWNAMAGSRVLILIDDIPLLSGDMGQIPWDLIPIENIDQIEVTKGAASAIYGSSAMNGVINVKTKTANQMLISQHLFLKHHKYNLKNLKV